MAREKSKEVEQRERALRQYLKDHPIGELPKTDEVARATLIPYTSFALYMEPHRRLGTVVLRGRVWFKVADFYD